MRRFFIGILIVLGLSFGFFSSINTNNLLLAEDPLDPGIQSPPLPPLNLTV